MYRRKCSIAAAPFAGLIYVIFNPRFTWLKGSIGFVSHIVRRKVAQPNLSIKAHAASFETRYWKSIKEYWHMFWNNVVLLSAWGLMCWAVGTVLFFTIYLISASLAGGAALFCSPFSIILSTPMRAMANTGTTTPVRLRDRVF